MVEGGSLSGSCGVNLQSEQLCFEMEKKRYDQEKEKQKEKPEKWESGNEKN